MLTKMICVHLIARRRTRCFETGEQEKEISKMKDNLEAEKPKTTMTTFVQAQEGVV